MTIEEKQKAGLSKFAAPKAVVKLDAEGNVVERYISMNQCAEAEGISTQAISNAIHRHTQRKGFYFDYAVKKQKFKMPERSIGFNHIRHIPYGGI